MKRHSIIIGILAASATAQAQLQFGTTLEPTSSTIGQPVLSNYTLTNIGKTVTGDLCLEHRCGLVELEIVDPLGETRRFASIATSIGQRARRTPKQITLGKGDSIEHQGCIGFDERTQDFAFPLVGDYLVRGMFASPTGEITSKQMSISVANPKGKAADALAYIRKNGLERYLCSDEAVYYDITKKETIAALEGLEKKYGDTPYGQAAEGTLRALGVSGHLSPFPSEVDFGEVPINATSTYQVLFRNDGMQPVEVSAFGTLGAPFALPTPPKTPITLVAGGEIEVDLTYTPTEAGTHDDVWTIEASSGSVDVVVRGEGSTAPRLRFSVESVDFGQVSDGSNKTAQFDVRNDGLEPLILTGFSPLRAPFSYVQLPDLPATLEEGQTLPVEVRFGATPGTFETSLMVDSNDPWEAQARLDLFAVGTTGGDGCGCELGAEPGAHDNASAAAWLAGLLIAMAALRRRRS